MKTAIKIFTGVLLLLLLFACPEEEITNPFDPKCLKEIWTPFDFQAVQEDNKLDLTWKQENTNISGFKIERKVGNEEWSNIASPGKTTTSWSDSDLKGGEIHQYRLYAYAGDNFSNTVTTQITPVFTASLTTATLSELTCNSATLGGIISNTGGANITERGIVYAKTASPITSDTKITMGNGEGSFNQSISGLEEKTTYYARAYAINSAGTSYGNQISFTTPACAVEATVITNVATNISSTNATLGGNVTDDGGATVSERGVVYSISQNPTTANNKVTIESGTGSFSKTVTGLTENTTYFVRAYAINSKGTAYGNQVSFKTSQTLSPATLTTNPVTDITTNSAIMGGNITSDGNATVSERGVVYSTSQNPTIANYKVTIGNGTGSFNKTVTGLAENTTYYVRAYAINSEGTAYGNQLNFKTGQTLSLPTLTTNPVTDITKNSAVMGGNISSDGNAPVTERGVVYSTSQNPTITSNKVAIGNGTGSFSKTVTGLAENTTYYVRAYAINSQGAAYGNPQAIFKTGQTLSPPTLTTNPVISITPNSAVMGGNITSDGNAPVTERGVVYSTSQNPTTANTKVIIGSGTGSFSKSVSGLTENTTYYVRAYAINSQGTAYGNPQAIFKTGQTLSLSTLTTNPVTDITANSAVLGGNITSDGNATVTERGVVYSTSQNPTTANNKVTIGNGTGSFSKTVTGLTENTTYYVRAYAINSQGTAYGNQVTVKIPPSPPPTVTTNSVTDITPNSAVMGGNVTSEGNATITERGVVYNTSQNPTTANNKVAIGNGTGSFSKTVTGLADTTTYYVRAYAINSQGTAYGDQVIFNTLQTILTVTPSSRAVTSAAGTTTFSVNSNVDWKVNVDATWLTVVKTSSIGISVSYQANTTTNSRTATITVSGSDKNVNVQVFQAGIFDVSPDSRNVSWQAGTTSFTVSSGVGWSVDEDASWLTATKTSGSEISVSYEENTSTNSRTANIRAYGTGGVEESVTVTQSSNVIAYYPLIQSAKDNTGNYADIIVRNCIWYVSGIYSNGIYWYDDSGCLIQTPIITGLNKNSFEVSVDFYTDQSTAERPVFIVGISYREFGFLLNSNKTITLLLDNNQRYPSNQQFSINTWQNAKIIYMNGIANLYLNNTLIISKTFDVSFPDSDRVITNNNFSNGTAFKGWWKNLVIKNK